MDGPLLSMLGEIERGAATMDSLEVFSRRWEEYEGPRLSGIGLVEASLICEGLARSERLDLACHTALCMIARAWAAGLSDQDAALIADAGWGFFDAYAEQLWEGCDEQTLRTGALMGQGPSAWVTYPVRCMRVAELIGLLGLRVRMDDEQSDEVEAEIAEWLAQFIYRQPGAAHPISDRYAACLIPPAVLLRRHKPRAAKKLLAKTTVWICDRYEGINFGLASATASPIEEIERLLGGPYEHVRLRQKRRQSLAAAVCLDLSGLSEYRTLYADIRNDQLAVHLVPTILRCSQDADQYRLTGSDNRYELNPEFPDLLDVNAMAAMPHHRDDEDRKLLTIDRPMDLLAVSAALRDRYFCGAIRQII